MINGELNKKKVFELNSIIDQHSISCIEPTVHDNRFHRSDKTRIIIGKRLLLSVFHRLMLHRDGGERWLDNISRWKRKLRKLCVHFSLAFHHFWRKSHFSTAIMKSRHCAIKSERIIGLIWGCRRSLVLICQCADCSRSILIDAKQIRQSDGIFTINVETVSPLCKFNVKFLCELHKPLKHWHVAAIPGNQMTQYLVPVASVSCVIKTLAFQCCEWPKKSVCGH